MKYGILLAMAICLTACGNDEKDESHDTGNGENVEQHSGESISPQLESESDARMSVDTVSDAKEAEEEKKEDLH